MTVLDLLMQTPQELLAIPMIGEKTLVEIYSCLESIGFFRKGRGPRADEALPAAPSQATGLQVKTDVQLQA